MLKKMKLTMKKANVMLMPVILFFVFTVLPFISLAQADFESQLDAAATGTDASLSSEVPIDGGTVFLVAAGVLFGVYKLYKVAQNRMALSN